MSRLQAGWYSVFGVCRANWSEGEPIPSKLVVIEPSEYNGLVSPTAPSSSEAQALNA